MSTAAMKLTDQPQADALPLFYANAARYRHWCNKVERFKATQGVRALLDHVTPDEWQAHYAANEDAFSAVVIELERVDT